MSYQAMSYLVTERATVLGGSNFLAQITQNRAFQNVDTVNAATELGILEATVFNVKYKTKNLWEHRVASSFIGIGDECFKPNCSSLWAVKVKDKFQGIGIATFMLETLFDVFDSWFMDDCALSVTHGMLNTPACLLYKRFGFEPFDWKGVSVNMKMLRKGALQ